MEIVWSGQRTKADHHVRKHIENWSVPKRYRDKFYLPDGMKVTLRIQMADLNESVDVTLTSGGEFHLPHTVAKKIEGIWDSQPLVLLSFHLDLASHALMIGDLMRAIVSDPVMPESNNENELPQRLLTMVHVFRRRSRVVSDVLRRAAGVCEVCGTAAPFTTRMGEPYLEVHHVQWLASGGLDNTDNALALCPNCHREAHLGNLTEWAKKLPNDLRPSALNNV